ADARPDQIRARFQELHSEYQVRLTNAPTPNLKKLYQQKLQELDEAAALLGGEAGGDDHQDLPAAEPVYDAGAVHRPNAAPSVTSRRESTPTELTGLIVMRTDADATVRIDGAMAGRLTAGTPLRVAVSAGGHMLEVLDSAGRLVLDEDIIVAEGEPFIRRVSVHGAELSLAEAAPEVPPEALAEASPETPVEDAAGSEFPLRGVAEPDAMAQPSHEEPASPATGPTSPATRADHPEPPSKRKLAPSRPLTSPRVLAGVGAVVVMVAGVAWFGLPRGSASTATLRGQGGAVYSVAFSPDGTQLVSGSNDWTVRLWDVASGTVTATLRGHMGGVGSVAFSPDGTRLVSGSFDRTVRLWDASGEPVPEGAASRGETATLRGHEGGVRSVAFSPDGTRLVSGSNDDTVRLWDVASGTETATLRGHMGGVGSVAFSPDGTQLVSGSDAGTIRLWDVASGTETATLRGNERPVSVAFSPDGTQLVSGSYETVRLWDVASGTVTATLRGHEGTVYSVAFSPDGTQLVSSSSGRQLVSSSPNIKLWDVASGAETATLSGHAGTVYSVAFSPDGTQLVSGSDDGTIRLGDVPR
ncbi:MAG: hypothetical protein V3T24_00680, partial [Longimicrobiales bacterium]